MYEALINSLRVCAGNDISCEGCLFAKQDPNEPAYVRYCGIIQEAADALEKLAKENESMEHVIHCCQCKFWNEKNGKCGISLEIIDDPNFFCANGEKDLSKEYIDRKTLLDAQVHPENYRDLIVRVAGYSAQFIALDKTVQDDIICRTEFDRF